MPPPPGDGGLGPWLLTLLVLVVAAIAAYAVFLRDGEDSGPQTVPALIGLREDEAVKRVRERGLQPYVARQASAKEAGVVVGQDPQAGESLAADQLVQVVVSSGRTDSSSPPPADAEQTGTVETVPPPPATTDKTTTSTQAERVEVLDLVGAEADAAVGNLERNGLRAAVRQVPSDEPQGVVVAQRPAPGTGLRKGATVTLNVSRGRPPDTTPEPATMPDVVGRPEAEARAALRDAGLEASVERVPSLEPGGTVVAQAKAPGTELERGSQVQINVSNGERPGSQPGATTTVPDVVGLTLAEARSQLRAAGIVASVKRVPSVEAEDTVVAQAKRPGTKVPRGSQMQVNVSNGELPG